MLCTNPSDFRKLEALGFSMPRALVRVGLYLVLQQGT